MLEVGRNRAWHAVSFGAASAADAVVRIGLRRGWKGAMGSDPPDNPAAPDVTWGRALLWAAATGLSAGVARVIARRFAATAWHRITGSWPPLRR